MHTDKRVVTPVVFQEQSPLVEWPLFVSEVLYLKVTVCFRFHTTNNYELNAIAIGDYVPQEHTLGTALRKIALSVSSVL